jgi:hypothetical protein
LTTDLMFLPFFYFCVLQLSDMDEELQELCAMYTVVWTFLQESRWLNYFYRQSSENLFLHKCLSCHHLSSC